MKELSYLMLATLSVTMANGAKDLRRVYLIIAGFFLVAALVVA